VDPGAGRGGDDSAAPESRSHRPRGIAVDRTRRIDEDTDPEHGLDWDAILRQYLRFPRFESGRWEKLILSSPAVVEPTFPNFRMLGPDFGADKPRARREGKKAAELEARYQALEAQVDQ
jgi:hypothetical protein